MKIQALKSASYDSHVITPNCIIRNCTPTHLAAALLAESLGMSDCSNPLTLNTYQSPGQADIIWSIYLCMDAAVGSPTLP